MKSITLRVKDIMTTPVITIRKGTTVSKAASIMSKHHVGGLVVVDEKERPIGMLTERDLVRKIVATYKDPRTTRVEEIMSSPLVAGNPEMTLEEAAKLMIKMNVKRLPIIREEELVGILTFTDIIRTYPDLVESLKIEKKIPRRFRKLIRF